MPLCHHSKQVGEEAQFSSTGVCHGLQGYYLCVSGAFLRAALLVLKTEVVIIVRVVAYKLADNCELHMSKRNYLPAALKYSFSSD